ncbi:hypothetical protein GBAR_LOCUS31748, partial [Geodia barretti]
QGAEVRSWPVWTRLWPTRSSRKSGSSTQQLWQTSPPKSPSPITNLTTSSTTTTQFTTPHTILVAVQQWWLVTTVPRPTTSAAPLFDFGDESDLDSPTGGDNMKMSVLSQINRVGKSVVGLGTLFRFLCLLCYSHVLTGFTYYSLHKYHTINLLCSILYKNTLKHIYTIKNFCYIVA